MTSERIQELLKVAQVEKNCLSSCSDNDNSYLFSAIFKAELCYVPERKSWFYYDGVKWVHDVGSIETSLKAKQLANELFFYVKNLDKGAKDTSVMANALRWQKKRVRDTVIEDAKAFSSVSITEFDNYPHLLNCQNGIYNLDTEEFTPHDYSLYLTKSADTNYVEGATDERFNLFIAEIMNDDGIMCNYLQKALGYSLVGSNELECLFILYGATTRNGKSTLMETVLNVLGDYAASVSPETIAQTGRSGNAPSEDLARLKGKRLANISEPPSSLIFNAARVKTITGNDTINARFLHENSFEYKPEFTLFINTNYLPKVSDRTLFKSDRIKIIPFERHFAPEEQDITLKESFRRENVKSAVLTWLINGYKLYKLMGLTQPEKALGILTEYEKSSDKLSQFVEEMLVESNGAATPTAEIYEAYKSWCLKNGYQPYAKNKFSEGLKSFGEIKDVYANGKTMKRFLNYCLADPCA